MRETLWLFLHLETMKTLLLRLWRIWFYLLAGIPVPFLFPFLAIALLFPKGYTIVFWVARNIWAPIILGGSGFYTKIRYAKPLPTGTSYVLVANHTSYIDPFVMLRVSKNPFVFVGKKELVKIPIFGYLYKRAAVMVNRSDKKSRWEVYGRVQQKLDLGYSVCIFPEVSYEDDTIFLNPFKRGAFKIAIDHQLPVELRVQTFPELYPPKSMEELPVFQEEIRDIIDQGLRDDPKGRQFEAVALEEKRGS